MSSNTFFCIVAIGLLLSFIVVEPVGVCYGRRGNNLPPPNEVVDLYKSYKIGGIQLYDTNNDILQALKGSNIPVILNVVHSDLSAIAANPSAATRWVQNNIQSFSQDVNFRYIAVGNKIIPGALASNVLPAMKNIQNALQAAGLQGRIKVSTSVSPSVLGASYPPSAGVFSSNIHDTLQPIISFLANNSAPLLANVYPYFSYIKNPANIALNYALFTSPGAVVNDGPLQYQNLFDAMVDTFFAALEKMGGGNVTMVVSETGWPSNGGGVATQQNAQTYLSKLINHVNNGTPKKPGVNIETYIFAMFDENMKQPGTKNHYGLFNANKSPKYSLPL